jgi:N-acetylmuramoyl-L-alanine amidase
MHEVYEKIIVIDAGHGGSMPGAVKNDIYEKNLNLQIVQKLKELLDKVDEKKELNSAADMMPGIRKMMDIYLEQI